MLLSCSFSLKGKTLGHPWDRISCGRRVVGTPRELPVTFQKRPYRIGQLLGTSHSHLTSTPDWRSTPTNAVLSCTNATRQANCGVATTRTSRGSRILKANYGELPLSSTQCPLSQNSNQHRGNLLELWAEYIARTFFTAVIDRALVSLDLRSP